MYEVELKFAVAEFTDVKAGLDSWAAAPLPPETQLDLYYQHPARNFAETDEALRIRRTGFRSWITYKGPRVDATTKTRREIELPLAADGPAALARWEELLQALGFVPAGRVEKVRLAYAVQYRGRAVVVALDRVAGLGAFVELETEAQASDLDAARGTLLALAGALGLSTPERRSYLELLELRRPAS